MHLPWADRQAGPVTFSTSVQPEEAAELSRLAKGCDVLEIGSAFGYSACVMALAGARHVTAVDPHTWIAGSQDAMNAAVKTCKAARQVTVIAKTSFEALPELAAQGKKFGLIFVDGDHSAHAVRHDGEWAEKLLEPGGTIAFHDYGEDCCCPGVREALNGMYPKGADKLTGTLFTVTP